MVRRNRLTDGQYDNRRHTWRTGTGQWIRGVHDKSLCAGRPCVVHAPSDHCMRSFPTHLRIPGPFDIKPMHAERICPHGIGHPDPDDLAFWESVGVTGLGAHGCDGCCYEEGGA